MNIRTLLVDQWYRIAFTVLAVGITTAAVVMEFRVNYVERAIGRYLTWHNADRQEAGQIWETVTKSEEVQQQLDDLVQDRRAQVSLDEQVASLAELITMVTEREQVILTRDRFLEIYNQMPVYQSALIVEPVQLLQLTGSLEGWQRVLIESSSGELIIYLVDGNNEVLTERRLAADYVTYYMSGADTRALDAGAATQLGGQEPYPAEVFYSAWAKLPVDQREGIPLSSDNLLSWRYRLQRVAVDLHTLVGDRLEVAFELSGYQGLTTVRVLGRGLAVLYLANEMNLIAGREPISTEGVEN